MPRTQTNDAAPAPYRGLQRLTAANINSPGGIIWQNTHVNVTIVVVTMDVVSVSGGTGANVAVGIAPGGGSTQIRVFGASTGSGNYDTFSWRGYLPLLYNDQLVCVNVGGTWDFTAAGYAIPTPGLP